MQIKVENAGKRFGPEWVLKNLNFELTPHSSYVIVGPNGSGKSTLMKMLSGFLSPTKGNISFQSEEGIPIMPDQIYTYCAYAAPYIELIEEFTMRELFTFHMQARGLTPGVSMQDLIEITQLQHAADREIRHFSSGMKQRLKIALALCSKAEYILLDEPTTNLDQNAVKWYIETTNQLRNNRLLIIASNDPADLCFAEKTIQVQNFK